MQKVQDVFCFFGGLLLWQTEKSQITALLDYVVVFGQEEPKEVKDDEASDAS